MPTGISLPTTATDVDVSLSSYQYAYILSIRLTWIFYLYFHPMAFELDVAYLIDAGFHGCEGRR